MMTFAQSRRLTTSAAFVFLSLVAACGGTDAPPAVASVQMTTTNSNPRVGEATNITAKAVNDGGVEVPGVACTFSSSAPAVASVNATSGAVSALSVGTAVITAACGGRANTITLTIRPLLRTLTTTKTGGGSGAVFGTPAGGSYDDGTSVTVTASAIAGSVFTGWSGACAGTGACVILMNADRSVTANFEINFAGTWTGTWSWAGPGGGGCAYTDGGAFSMTLTQTGTTVSGPVNSAAGLQSRNTSNCALLGVETDAGDATGTTSGSTLTLSFTLNGSLATLSFTATAAVTTTTLTGTITRSTGGTGNLALTRP